MPKTVILVRHGESLGQTARSRGLKRSDDALADCYLSDRGVRQARIGLPSLMSNLNLGGGGVGLVCTSPLTRAVATAALAFGDIVAPDPWQMEVNGDEEDSATVPFICHPELAEVGLSIPENFVRPVQNVRRDLTHRFRHFGPAALAAVEAMDATLLDPTFRERPPLPFLEWLRRRPEDRVVVVCHYNVMLRNLLNFQGVAVSNCVPIPCILNEDGTLVPSSSLLPEPEPNAATARHACPSENRKNRSGKKNTKGGKHQR